MSSHNELEKYTSIYRILERQHLKKQNSFYLKQLNNFGTFEGFLKYQEKFKEEYISLMQIGYDASYCLYGSICCYKIYCE